MQESLGGGVSVTKVTWLAGYCCNSGTSRSSVYCMQPKALDTISVGLMVALEETREDQRGAARPQVKVHDLKDGLLCARVCL